MFHPEDLTRFYEKHAPTLALLDEVSKILNSRFYQMEDAVEAMMLAALSGEAMVMIGPPGTAKSRLVRSFCHLVGLVDNDALNFNASRDDAPRQHRDYFEYLLTQFTEPSELFGFYDLRDLQTTGLVRKSENMMQEAKVVFLDEIFNASSAILNSLLTFVNERKFHDHGKAEPVALELLFAATNHPPQEAGLTAVYDRFLLRCHVQNIARRDVDVTEISDLIKAGWSETHATLLDRSAFEGHDLMAGLAALRLDVDVQTKNGGLRINLEDPIYTELTDLVRETVRRDLSLMSNRRMIKLTGLMFYMRLLRAVREDSGEVAIQPRDLDVVTRFSLDREDPSLVARYQQRWAEL